MVLIVGITGFLGSNLARALRQRGDTVLGLRRGSDIAEAFRYRTIGAVVFAATNYGRKGESCMELLETNVGLPLSVYGECCRNRVPRFINIHTALPRTVSPYALSKHQLCEWLALHHGHTQILHLRSEHFYGPGDDTGKFTGWLFERLFRDEDVPLSSGEQKRDFVFIEDAVSAIIACMDQPRDAFAEIATVDLGSGETVAIREFAEMAKAVFASGSRLDFGKVPYRKNEVMESVADIARLRDLGWSPQTSLHDGVMACAKHLDNP